MRRAEVIDRLSHELKRLSDDFGVRELLLFGSIARDEATPSSDVDLLVRFGRPTGLFGLIRLKEHLEELLGRAVDLGTPNSLKPRLRDRVLQEAVRVTASLD
jgi:predicted nucleotidyltransferase